MNDTIEEKVVQEPETEEAKVDETEVKPKAEVEPKAEDEAKAEAEADATLEPEAEEQAKDDAPKKKKTASESLKDAWKQVFGHALNVALKGRGNVVMVRINDEALTHLDMLVDADITKSRSESAAFLINEGIRMNQELYARIGTITQQISDLRAQLRDEVQREMQANKQ